MTDEVVNDNLLYIGGMSTMGKSASLRNLKNPEKVMYLNCEHKKTPFRNRFQEFKIVDPLQVYEAFTAAEDMDIDVIALDSVTFMMSMFEQMHIINNPPLTKGGSPDTLAGWGNYGTFFRRLMTEFSANSTKTRVFLGHNKETYNKEQMVKETKAAIKGSLNDTGIEAYFSTCINAKRLLLEDLAGYENDLLTITPEDEALGYKYVFQTRLTKDTVTERIRSPMGMWAHNETYIDNDIQLVLDRLDEFYN